TPPRTMVNPPPMQPPRRAQLTSRAAPHGGRSARLGLAFAAPSPAGGWGRIIRSGKSVRALMDARPTNFVREFEEVVVGVLGKGCILWAVGVPLPIIILLYMFGLLHSH